MTNRTHLEPNRLAAVFSQPIWRASYGPLSFALVARSANSNPAFDLDHRRIALARRAADYARQDRVPASELFYRLGVRDEYREDIVERLIPRHGFALSPPAMFAPTFSDYLSRSY
jgi:hypothetical protein